MGMEAKKIKNNGNKHNTKMKTCKRRYFLPCYHKIFFGHRHFFLPRLELISFILWQLSGVILLASCGFRVWLEYINYKSLLQLTLKRLPNVLSKNKKYSQIPKYSVSRFKGYAFLCISESWQNLTGMSASFAHTVQL